MSNGTMHAIRFHEYGGPEKLVLDTLERPAPKEGEVLPTCHWTLDRLQAELAKDGIPIKRSQIRRLLKAEHLKWQKPRTWLESTDPDFAEKRGPSSSFTPIPPWAAR